MKIIDSVSDQATSNVAAIKYLNDDTDASYKGSGLENRNFILEVDNCEVVSLYDTLHLWK